MKALPSAISAEQKNSLPMLPPKRSADERADSQPAQRSVTHHSLHTHACIALLRVFVLPRLTRSLAVEFVEKRKNELQDYLRALLETPGLVHSPIILAFLEVPDSVRPMLAAAQHHQQQSGASSQAAGGSVHAQRMLASVSFHSCRSISRVSSLCVRSAVTLTVV